MDHDLGLRIGSHIKSLREARGLTQAGLARAIAKTTLSISKIERGKVIPGLITLESIASALGISLRELIPTSPPAVADTPEESASSINDRLSRLGSADRRIVAGLVDLMLEEGKRQI